MQNLLACRRLRRMKFCRSPQAVRGICLSCMRVTAQRGFFVSVVRFAYRVYASWTSIRLPRAVAAHPSRYAYFCAVSHASAVSASRLHRVFQKHENLSYYNFRFFAASPAANCRRAVSLPALAVPASSFSGCALKFWSKSPIWRRVRA